MHVLPLYGIAVGTVLHVPRLGPQSRRAAVGVPAGPGGRPPAAGRGAIHLRKLLQVRPLYAYWHHPLYCTRDYFADP